MTATDTYVDVPVTEDWPVHDWPDADVPDSPDEIEEPGFSPAPDWDWEEENEPEYSPRWGC